MRKWGSAGEGCGLLRSVEFRDGGGRAVEELTRVDEDLVRVWPIGGFAPVEIEVADVLRVCLDVTTGGLDRSFFTGSGSVFDEVAAFLIEDVLCNPPVAGLLTFARGGGGPIDPLPLLIVLPVALGGRLDMDVDVLRVTRVGGFTGNRLGDWLDLPDRDVLFSLTSAAFTLPICVPETEGFRKDRVREGMDDMVF